MAPSSVATTTPSHPMYSLDSSKDYPFVPSTAEHHRLNEQSTALNELMFNKITHAPLHSPTKILDVGCGTGIQTRLLAKLYPEALVVGVDEDPIPDDVDEPGNVRFVGGKVEELVGKHDLLQAETFDLLYQRYLVMNVSDWQAHTEQLRTLLKPGGWFESQESQFFDVFNEHGELVSADWRFSAAIRRSTKSIGYDVDIGANMPSILAGAGFDEISTTSYPVLWRSGWNAKPETEKLGRYHEWAAPSTLHMFIRRSVLPDAGEDAEELVREFDDKMLNGPIGTHSKFHVTIARKPLDSKTNP